MTTGNWNRKFGWIWLLIGPIMGLYITNQFHSLGAAYAAVMKEVTVVGQTVAGQQAFMNLTLYMGEGLSRTPNRLLHVHSGLLAFLNIIYGMSIDGAALSDKTKKVGSVLAIAGAILVTIGFALLQVMSLSSLGFPLRVLGGISVVAAIVILAAGEFKK